MRPAVSVLMSVRNGAEFLRRSIRSILDQSMKDFEFLIADDMSTDGTAAILCSAAAEDKRIRLVVNYENMGLTRSLNKLIGMAKGKYLARIDADDAARSDRLERQCMDMERDYIMSTSCYRTVDSKGNHIYSHCPHHDQKAMEWSLVFRNNIRHSTVMWRSDLGLRYEEKYRYAQDYDMWCRIYRLGRVSVAREPLADIRTHDSAITSGRRRDQDEAAEQITMDQFKYHTGKDINMNQSRNLRLIHHLRDQIQYDQFSAMGDHEIKEAISLYSCLIEKFQDSAEVAEEIRKDMTSIMDARKGSDSEREAFEVLCRFGKKQP